ncbi:hypothetical protein [Candidatus Cyanaurora vandensis]|uniref:hypothetical protein n=1 Tax=Candidatus Cyanaurora vandensis TaxID=2714958 RepID=UPI00257D2608|nr:hypothetical protein [Candidatus Cyanaurora vandensis]
MPWWLLLGLGLALPGLAQPITATRPLTATRYFLLRADGEAFKDSQKKPVASLTQGRYTSRLLPSIVRRGSSIALGLTLTAVDRTHHLSQDRQVVTLEVDGTALPFPATYDSFSYRSADGTTENLHLTLQKTALTRILAAQELVLKTRLDSRVLAVLGECATTVAGSAKQRSCGNPYSGLVLRGPDLKRLQTLLTP